MPTPNDDNIRIVHLNCPDTMLIETFREEVVLRFFGESETVVIVQAVPKRFPVEISEHDYPSDREPTPGEILQIDAYCDQVCASIRDHQDWYMKYMNRQRSSSDSDSEEARLVRQAVCLAMQVALRPQCYLTDSSEPE